MTDLGASATATAFLLGLLGNVHCVAMCGGIVGALSQRESGASKTLRGSLADPLLYNGGRIASYTLAGAIAGASGSVVAGWLGANGVLGLRGIFGVLMLAVGLALLGWGQLARALERSGEPIWRLLSRGITRLRPAESPWQSLLLGAIWGWLPCGLVYAALMGSVASGSGLAGASFMLAFGLGTLPALLAVGTLASRLRMRLSATPVRMAAGAAIAIFGVWTLGGAVLGYRHWEHSSAAHGPNGPTLDATHHSGH